MKLYYICTKYPAMPVNIGDLVQIPATAILEVSVLPVNVGDNISLVDPANRNSVYDYQPIAIGMDWR